MRTTPTGTGSHLPRPHGMTCVAQLSSTARPLGSEGMARRSKACGRRLSLRDQAKISSGRCAKVTWVLAFTLLLLCFLPSTVLADPPTFATASGNCSDRQITFPAQSSAHPDTLIWFQSVGSQGVLDGWGLSFGEGDTGWLPYGAVEAGTVPTDEMNCSSGSVNAALADRPSAPATFSGATSPGTRSFLSFQAPGAGQYVLDATLTQGAITVGGVSGIIESSGEYSLGAVGAGDVDLPIVAQSGPPAQWTLTVRELPVAINGLSFGQAFMAPGTGLPASFSVTGATTITATVTNSAGQIVRSLGTFPVSEGSSSIPWDGRGSGGASLPDGLYTLSLASADPSGDTTTAQTTLTLDGTPPTAVMTSPQTIPPHHPGPVETPENVGNQATVKGKFVASNAPPPAPKPRPAPKPKPKMTRREPTSKERTKIAAADGIPARCETIYVSTTDRSWALATTNSRCPQLQAGGYSILHYNRHWQIVTEGDEPGCKVPRSRHGQPAIPRRIWTGLENLRCQ